MSLRSFHIVFVTVVAIFCALLTLWGLWKDEVGILITAICGLLLLPVYGIYFLKKSKHLDQ